MTLRVCTENTCIDEDVALFHKALSEEGERLGERFAVLARILGQMGYRG